MKNLQEPKYTPKDFHEEYNKLCERMGFTLISVPLLVQTNHGTYEIASEIRIVDKPTTPKTLS